ncbi:MAG: SDR family NAD(P)-dependent oxidoreductase [Oceanococcaceae bacterium]
MTPHTDVPSSPSPAATIVVGASGGIGQAICEQLRATDAAGLIIRTSRTPLAPEHGGTEPAVALDLTDPTSIDAAARQIGDILTTRAASLQRILICSGTLHGDDHQPERKLDALDPAAFAHVMAVNATGPLLVARALLPLMPRSTSGLIAAISARVGSISDNRMGGWYSYRCSKAALNMGFRSLAHELQRTHPAVTTLLYHPGTVATALSAPFAGNPKHARLTPADAAQHFARVIETHAGRGGIAFVDWNNVPIAW